MARARTDEQRYHHAVREHLRLAGEGGDVRNTCVQRNTSAPA
jgi:hypothetical protein